MRNEHGEVRQLLGEGLVQNLVLQVVAFQNCLVGGKMQLKDLLGLIHRHAVYRLLAVSHQSAASRPSSRCSYHGIPAAVAILKLGNPACPERSGARKDHSCTPLVLQGSRSK